MKTVSAVIISAVAGGLIAVGGLKYLGGAPVDAATLVASGAGFLLVAFGKGEA